MDNFTTHTEKLQLIENFPDAMKYTPCWVNWVAEPKSDGKMGKIPKIGGSVKNASSTNPDHYRDFETCYNAFKNENAYFKYEGLGICFSDDYNLAFIDIDDCYDPKTKTFKKIKDLKGNEVCVKSLIDSIGSYTELSQSGTGIHIVYMTLEKNDRNFNHNGVENYEIDRFCALTGNMISPTNEVKFFLRIDDFCAQFKPEKTWGKLNSNDAEEVEIGENFEYITNQNFINYSINVVKKMMGNAPQGERNSMLFKCSAILGGYPLLNFDTIESILVDVMSKNNFDYDEKKEWKTIQNGFRAGRKKPHSAKTNEFYLRWLAEQNMNTNEQKQIENIPKPLGADVKGNPAYSSRQLVNMVYPKWEVSNLMSDHAHAERIGEFVSEDLRYARGLKWMVYNGKIWQSDENSRPKTLRKIGEASKIVRREAGVLFKIVDRLNEENRLGDAEALKKSADVHFSFAAKCESTKFKKDALDVAASHPKIEVDPETFNTKPFLIGFQNGTWDNGEFREHRREDYLTKLCKVSYYPDYDQSEWLAVLEAISGGREGFKRMLQDIAGYILAGTASQKMIFWLYGQHCTGKSTFAGLLQTLLGDMCSPVEPRQLGSKGERQRLMSELWNSRMAVCHEAGDSEEKINAQLLKAASGEDDPKARMLFKEAFNITATHVLMLQSNDAPYMEAYDPNLKMRIKVLPFDNKLNANGMIELTGGKEIQWVKKQPELPLALGFTAWAVEGLERFMETGDVYIDSCVEKSTDEFFDELDKLKRFWREVPLEDVVKGKKKFLLRILYTDWCEEVGDKPFQDRAFTKACKAAGLTDKKEGADGKEVDFKIDGQRAWILKDLAQSFRFSSYEDEAEKQRKPSEQGSTHDLIEDLDL